MFQTKIILFLQMEAPSWILPPKLQMLKIKSFDSIMKVLFTILERAVEVEGPKVTIIYLFSAGIPLESKSPVMAGMLPGVEFARRRRFHQGGSGGSLIKQTTRPISEFRSEKRDDKKLNEVALEARDRLEARLRASSSLPVNKRLDYYSQRHLQSGYGNSSIEGQSGINVRDLHASTNIDTNQTRELVGLSKGFIDNLKRETYSLSRRTENPLLKLLPRNPEQVDCPICLDCFELNQVIIRLPCRHKFHPNCLIPWLEKNNHCPYCRTKVLNKSF